MEVQRNSAHVARRPVHAGRAPGCALLRSHAIPWRCYSASHGMCCGGVRAWINGNCFKCSKMRKDVLLDICPARWHACTVAGVHPIAVF